MPQDLLGRSHVLSKRDEMNAVISCLSQKEKDLAKQYFNFVDVDRSGLLDKRELKVMLRLVPSIAIAMLRPSQFGRDCSSGLHCEPSRLRL